ncbi:uncharacterized protein LOC126979612 isoform X1 [Leptidea sinapis]|uniref:uncharacterized protein LOC126979612 isoform X1 n=1 Tax=Leptidea sinapis TaxID=189913 RepID=UPI0021C3FEAB|nr:uncharacterized protein LOC126979612 isoform X1 [Leptidea sinapis]
MDTAGDVNTNDYNVTALHIFDYCGVDASSTLKVDVLMEKFAPFVQCNNVEYTHLKSLLDPKQNNPDITVSILAETLSKYSEDQKFRVNLDESFNLKGGLVPNDFDSGISTDGFQLVEELQCELREKCHLANQLRSQLEFTDRQHEEALAGITAERDSLRLHLNMLREENVTLSHARGDYEEACERLCSIEGALGESRRDLDVQRKQNKILKEQVTMLETEKLTLQDLLSKSKEECHRINEMYAGRQSVLLEENETFRTENALLVSRLQDQEECMEQIYKEKKSLEMELKNLMNKSNQNPFRLDNSIDVSYTEEQMLAALDSLNSETKFCTDNRILNEESFVNALREEHGRTNNISLLDEIRHSFSNMSRFSIHDMNPLLESSFVHIATQTSESDVYLNDYKVDNVSVDSQTDRICVEAKWTQTIGTVKNLPLVKRNMARVGKPRFMKNKNTMHSNMQTDELEPKYNNETMVHSCMQTDCYEFKTNNKNTMHSCMQADECELKTNIKNTVDSCMQKDDFLLKTNIKNTVDSCMQKDDFLLKINIKNTMDSCMQTDDFVLKTNNKNTADSCLQTEDFELRTNIKNTVHFSMQTDDFELNTNTKNTVDSFMQTDDFDLNEITEHVCLQTDNIELKINNNNDETCKECTKCFECEKPNEYVTKSKSDLQTSRNTSFDLEKYEKNLDILKNTVYEENEQNAILKQIVEYLKSKLESLEKSCLIQEEIINRVYCEKCCVEVQTVCEQVSVSSQTDFGCSECVKRSKPLPRLKRLLWEPLKCLFQLFAVICFIFAVSVLYGVTRRWHARCGPTVPWGWLQPQDFIDLLFHIEHLSDSAPM